MHNRSAFHRYRSFVGNADGTAVDCSVVAYSRSFKRKRSAVYADSAASVRFVAVGCRVAADSTAVHGQLAERINTAAVRRGLARLNGTVCKFRFAPGFDKYAAAAFFVICTSRRLAALERNVFKRKFSAVCYDKDAVSILPERIFVCIE